MANLPTAIRGTLDVLPKDVHKWQYIEKTLLDTASLFGFSELRIPVFEHTELFQRSVGDTTDVVQKEMYTFEDKGGRSITLRPEGTAGSVRSFLEHGLYNDALPVKVCYLLSCYRYEKPQAGRLREFHQFGVECFGAPSPVADAEVILLANMAFKALGLKGLELQINSIGCPECRSKYLNALKEYFISYKDQLCNTCLERLDRNPMRILDCKSPICGEISKNAPKMLDYLCAECNEHFEAVKAILTTQKINYVVNPTIVRGLDYYTRTVFEFVSTNIGAQGTVCAGGRYDGLVSEMGGPYTPSLGFALGMERLVMLMDQESCEFPSAKQPDIFIAAMGENASVKAEELCSSLRSEGYVALTDVNNRGLKAQMKYANKIGAKYSVVLGDNEIQSSKAELKDMDSGEKTEIDLNNFVEDFYSVVMKKSFDDMTDSVNNFSN